MLPILLEHNNSMDENQTDEELAAQTQAGNQAAFTVLFARYEKKILRYGRRFLYNYSDLEDAVQEVFIKAYRNIQSFIVAKKFSTWLYRIAHNTFINVIKKKGREPIAFFDFDTFLQLRVTTNITPHELLMQEQDKKNLIENLAILPPKYREPLVLYYLEEMDYLEIADILQIPISTVGVRLRRAKAMLKKNIESP